MTTETLTDVQPATHMPRDAKPSELIRGWPQDQWCAGGVRIEVKGERMAYCAIGILAFQAGYDGCWTTDACRDFVSDTYGIPYPELLLLIGANDERGKDAAADELEEGGY